MRQACRAAVAILALVVPAALAQPQTIFEITNFSLPSQTIQYPDGFAGTVGATTTWPNEMGWQGDRIDIAFHLASAPPANAANYRLRIVMNAQYTQNFTMHVLAGPSPEALSEVKAEYIDTARVLSATIPVTSFAAGQTNYIRLQGTGVAVGTGQPAGVRWNRWTLTRTDPPMGADALRMDQLQRCANYTRDAILANGLVRDALLHSPDGTPFHPATPDAAGFALLALSAADRFGLLADAEELAERVLRAYAGHHAEPECEGALSALDVSKQRRAGGGLADGIHDDRVGAAGRGGAVCEEPLPRQPADCCMGGRDLRDVRLGRDDRSGAERTRDAGDECGRRRDGDAVAVE
jgi:hypothetical protein